MQCDSDFLGPCSGPERAMKATLLWRSLPFSFTVSCIALNAAVRRMQVTLRRDAAPDKHPPVQSSITRSSAERPTHTDAPVKAIAAQDPPTLSKLSAAGAGFPPRRSNGLSCGCTKVYYYYYY